MPADGVRHNSPAAPPPPAAGKSSSFPVVPPPPSPRSALRRRPAPPAPPTRSPSPGTPTPPSAPTPTAEPPTSDTPPQSPDLARPTLPTSELLLAVAACDADPQAIAARFNLSLETYLDWLSDPETARRLAAFIAQGEAVRIRRLEARHESALETLHELHRTAEHNADPIERRRAATAVARFAIFSLARSSSISRLFRGLAAAPPAAPAGPAGPAISRPHSAFAHAGDAPASADDPAPEAQQRFRAHAPRSANRIIRPRLIAQLAAPAPIPRPDPAHSPAQATARLLHLLQNCDEPRRGDGLRALFNHFTPIWQGHVEAASANDFARAPIDAYRTLIHHRSAVLHPTRFEEPPPWVRDGPIRALQTFEFIDIDGRAWAAGLTFARTAAIPNAPWLIDRVQIVPASAQPPPDTPPLTAQAAPPPLDPPAEAPEQPLSAADLAADAARLADLDRPRERPPPPPPPSPPHARGHDAEPGASPNMDPRRRADPALPLYPARAAARPAARITPY